MLRDMAQASIMKAHKVTDVDGKKVGAHLGPCGCTVCREGEQMHLPQHACCKVSAMRRRCKASWAGIVLNPTGNSLLTVYHRTA